MAWASGKRASGRPIRWAICARPRLDDRLGVGESDVLGRQDAEPPGDEDAVGAPSISRASQ